MATVLIQHLEVRDNRRGEPRVYVVGTRLRVMDIACQHEFHGESPEEIVGSFPFLTLGQVHAALSYFYDHREQILAELSADEELSDRDRDRFPKPAWNATPDGDSDSLPS